MDKKLLSQALLTMVCFGIWPAISQKAKLPQAWTTLSLGVALIIAALFVFWAFPKQSLTYRDTQQTLLASVSILIFAVMFNAIGSVAFTGIINSPSISAFTYVTMITAGVPIVIKLSALVMNQDEKMTWTNLAGIIGACISITLIMKK